MVFFFNYEQNMKSAPQKNKAHQHLTEIVDVYLYSCRPNHFQTDLEPLKIKLY